MAILKKLEALTIKDNFMFWAVMSRPENCKPFLEMTLGFPIGDLTVNTEKSLLYNPEYKGVRLDVEARDESHTHYNVDYSDFQFILIFADIPALDPCFTY